ncbi:A-kinase anchor protein 1, mitochondrial, partial [Orchesella cincta]
MTMTSVDIVVGGEDQPKVEGDNVDASHFFETSPIVRASLQDLLPAESLKNILGHKFRIVDYALDKFNEVNIMSVEVKSDEEFRLNEEILDIVEDTDLTLGRVPAVKEVVLARKPKDGLYHRAIVVKTEEAAQAYVYFFDVGGFETVKIGALKPVNEEIMTFPILGYHVLLQDVSISHKLVLKREHSTLMKRMERLVYNLKLGDPISNAGAFTEQNQVTLVSCASKIDLTKEIRLLKVWEWEKFSCGNGTDDEVCEKGAYGKAFRMRTGNELITTYNLRQGMEFTAEVSRVIHEQGSEKTILRVGLLNIASWLDSFNVLHNQMQRYAALITKCPFYPAIGEYCMFKLANNPDYKMHGIKVLGKWCRAIRSDVHVMYLMDLDHFIPYQNLPDEDYDIRRLYAEFSKIPMLTVALIPQENGVDMRFDKASEIFQPKKRFQFKITDAKEGENGLDGYCAEYSLIEKSSKK